MVVIDVSSLCRFGLLICATLLSLHTVWIAKPVQSLGKNKNKTGVLLYGLFVHRQLHSHGLLGVCDFCWDASLTAPKFRQATIAHKVCEHLMHVET